MPGRHQAIATPRRSNWIRLRPDDPASFPFLQGQSADTTTLPAKIEVIAAF